jgi:hypothetical protein
MVRRDQDGSLRNRFRTHTRSRDAITVPRRTTIRRRAGTPSPARSAYNRKASHPAKHGGNFSVRNARAAALGEVMMKHVTPWLAAAFATACVTGVQAADQEKSNIQRVFNDTVTPAEQVAYEAAVKRYNECLAQHGYKHEWVALSHETGDVYTYSYVTDPVAWSTFDEMHEIGKICDKTWQSEANPHLKGEVSMFLETQPEMSHVQKGKSGLDSKYLDVTFIKLKRGHEAREAFDKAAKDIAAAAEKANWASYYTIVRVVDGDRNAPTYIVTTPAGSWKEFGAQDNMSMWAMVEGVRGKEATAAIRKSANEAIEEIWSHIDSYNEELSYKPKK